MYSARDTNSDGVARCTVCVPAHCTRYWYAEGVVRYTAARQLRTLAEGHQRRSKAYGMCTLARCSVRAYKRGTRHVYTARARSTLKLVLVAKYTDQYYVRLHEERYTEVYTEGVCSEVHGMRVL